MRRARRQGLQGMQNARSRRWSAFRARNGNYRHGNETRVSKALRAETVTLMRECWETLDAI
jgi:hypothetical protein